MAASTYFNRESWRGSERPLHWFDLYGKDTGGSAKTYHLAGHDIPAKSGTLAGVKEARVLKFGTSERRASSPSGDYQVSNLQSSFSDYDNLFRGMLGRSTQYALLNTEVALRSLSYSDWVAGNDPLTVFRGVISRYEGVGDSEFLLTIKDWLGARLAFMLPMSRYDRNTFADFPTLPLALSSSGACAPFLLGSVTGANGATLDYIGDKVDAFGTTWRGFCLCWGAAKSIDDLAVYDPGTDSYNFVSGGQYGVDWLAFSKPSYGANFPTYYTVNGRTYTLVYGRFADADACAAGTKTLTAIAHGYETVGDGSGSTILTIADCLAWLLDNQLLPATPHTVNGGNWLSVPTWADGTAKRDTAAWTAANTDANAVISDNTCGIQIRTPVAFAEILKSFLVSGDFALGSNSQGQATITLLTPPPGGYSTARTVTAVSHLLAKLFGFVDDETQWATRLIYRFAFSIQKNTFMAGGQLDNSTAQADYQNATNPPTVTLQFPCRQATLATAAGQLAARAAARLKKPLRSLPLPRGLPGLMDDLGARILVTHPEGPAAAGWTNKPVQINAVVQDLDQAIITTYGWDIDWQQ